MKGDDHVSNPAHYHVNRAAALGTPYLLESNIKLLPDGIPDCVAAIDLLRNEEKRARLIGQNAILHYQQHPLSYAVDGNAGTAFRSPYGKECGTLSTLQLNDPHRCKTRRLHSH